MFMDSCICSIIASNSRKCFFSSCIQQKTKKKTQKNKCDRFSPNDMKNKFILIVFRCRVLQPHIFPAQPQQIPNGQIPLAMFSDHTTLSKRNRTRKIAAINEMKYGHEIICMLWGCARAPAPARTDKHWPESQETRAQVNCMLISNS